MPQIYNYERFQRETGIPVFVVIGIGGEPHDPEKLYVMPLDLISNDNVVLERELIPFRRKPGRRFFYDVRQGRLW